MQKGRTRLVLTKHNGNNQTEALVTLTTWVEMFKSIT